jgi:cytochrome c oxidase subunit 2
VLRVPAGQAVVLEITSQDVQHSFWVPELAGKVDAIPGRTQRLWFQVDQPGTYVGQCAEYCGREHYNMLINVEVMAPEAYAAWMGGQAAAVAAAQEAEAAAEGQVLTGDPASGEQLYISVGCNACHSLDGSAVVGPSFQGLSERAGTRIEGTSPEDYVNQAILHPCDFVVEGFTCVMPQNYGERLTAQNIADLEAFLLSQ